MCHKHKCANGFITSRNEINPKKLLNNFGNVEHQNELGIPMVTIYD